MSAYVGQQRFYPTHWLALSDWATSFLEVLGCIRSASCSDERDRIYAILDLRYLDHEPLSTAILGIQPDYTKPVNLLFAQVAYLCVKNFETQDMLAHVASSFSSLSSTPGLPSWVPDWSHSAYHTLIERQRRSWHSGSVETDYVADAYNPKVDKLTLRLSVFGAAATTVSFMTHIDLYPDDIRSTMEAVGLFWSKAIKPFRPHLNQSTYWLMQSQFVDALSGYDASIPSEDIYILWTLFGKDQRETALRSMMNDLPNVKEMVASLQEMSDSSAPELSGWSVSAHVSSYKRY